MSCKLISLGKNSTAFICGHKDHECDDSGLGILLLTGNIEVPATDENREKYKDGICGESVNCSICGKSAISQAYWL